jgi:large subunit ribosomal protein L31
MKAEIHPTYYTEAKVSCVCGNSFTTGSVLKEINVDICSSCHPFFSGKQKLIDTEGRVEKFKKKYASFYDKKK